MNQREVALINSLRVLLDGPVVTGPPDESGVANKQQMKAWLAGAFINGCALRADGQNDVPSHAFRYVLDGDMAPRLLPADEDLYCDLTLAGECGGLNSEALERAIFSGC